jgi:hypothetical protein
MMTRNGNGRTHDRFFEDALYDERAETSQRTFQRKKEKKKFQNRFVYHVKE